VGLTILIVDDHAGFRSARARLEADGYQIVREAVDGASAVIESARLRPGVVLLDIQLPDIHGFKVAERLVMGSDPPPMVLISAGRQSPTGLHRGIVRARLPAQAAADGRSPG
jgi:DNA-binding NarL/FixJ family response regulator